MRITDQHVSDEWITEEIAFLEKAYPGMYENHRKALLELKQRRAEQRQKDFDDGK